MRSRNNHKLAIAAVGAHYLASIAIFGEAFHYVDKGNMATVGRFSAIASIGKLQFSGWLAWFMWLVLHLFFLIGFRNRMVVLFQCIMYYTTFRRGARVITSEEMIH